MQKSLKKYFLSLIRPHKTYVFSLALISIYWAINNSLSPYVLKIIIDKAVNFHGDKTAILPVLAPATLLYLFLWFAIAVDMRLLDWVRLKFFPRLRYDIINSMFGYLNKHSHRYFQNNFAGSVTNKISDMTNGVITIFSTLEDGFAQVVGLLIAVATMLLVHPVFALLLLGWALAFMLIALYFFKPVQVLSNHYASSKTALMGKLVDSIGNISTVRLFARNNYENRLVQEAAQDTVDKDQIMQRLILKMRIYWDFSIIVLIGINLYMLLVMYSKNQVTIGDFSFILSLSMTIFFNLWWIASQFIVFAEELGKCKQALTILDTAHEITDASDAKPLSIKKGQIAFHGVSFRYNARKKLFNNKHVIIEAGQKVGLVGLSGSGKSTFVNLILRLFSIESGAISIDNQNISKVTKASLRENIAIIPQDVSLFHRSIMENIRYGRINASDEEVIEASKKAYCHEFIMQLSEGYSAMVGERGIKLSGGQRQRIAIARAILKNAPILILDEATSALDSVTEKQIQDSLQELMAGRTTLVIAHRLSTLSEMDRVLVFDKGRIVEDDAHEALIRNQGHYARMWQMQAGGFLPEKM